MSYFYSICTKENQDAPESAARDHAVALNAYLATPGPSGKPRHVHTQAMSQIVINMTIRTTTILCCNEDEDSD